MILIFPARARQGAQPEQAGGRGRTRRHSARRCTGAHPVLRGARGRRLPGRVRRAAPPRAAETWCEWGIPPAPGYGTSSARRRRKKNTGKTAAKVLLCIVLVLGLAFGGIYWYVGRIFNTGEMGASAAGERCGRIGARRAVRHEHPLVLGIVTATGAVKRDPIGQTDMILYVRVNGSDLR